MWPKYHNLLHKTVLTMTARPLRVRDRPPKARMPSTHLSNTGLQFLSCIREELEEKNTPKHLTPPPRNGMPQHWASGRERPLTQYPTHLSRLSWAPDACPNSRNTDNTACKEGTSCTKHVVSSGNDATLKSSGLPGTRNPRIRGDSRRRRASGSAHKGRFFFFFFFFYY